MSGDLAQKTRPADNRIPLPTQPDSTRVKVHHGYQDHAQPGDAQVLDVILGSPLVDAKSSPRTAPTDARSSQARASAARRFNFSWRPSHLALVAGAVVMAMVAVRALATLPARSANQNYTTRPVQQGPLRISVHDEGTIDSLNNSIVKNPVEWRTKILSVKPEGTSVEKGEIICELDSSELREKAKEREIILTRALASLKQAQEALGIQKSINDRNISAAQLKVELAALALEEYRDGTYQQKLLELENACTLAEENLSRSRETYDYSKRLTQKGYKTQSELEAARLALTKSEVSLQTAQEKRKVLDEYTSKRELAALEGEARESKFELTRVKMRASLLTTQATVRLAALERSALIHQNYYDRLQRNIEACTIRAPRSGELVYASSRSRHNRYPIDEGASAHHRQEMFALPDLTRLKVDVRVHEAQISNIKVGQRVLIRVNARNGKPFQGRIHAVSSLPQRGEFPNFELREYVVTVTFNDPPEDQDRLKPGLTASVEIILHELDDVIQLPAKSVVNVGEHSLAYVMTPRGPEPRHLKLGVTDDAVVVVEEGLEPGEEVVESPRTELAQQVIELRAQLERFEGRADAVE